MLDNDFGEMDFEDVDIDDNVSITETSDEFAEGFDVDDILETTNELDDITDTDESFEESFAKRIDSLSLDDLKVERERLIELGALDGDAIAQRYSDFMDDQADPEVSDETMFESDTPDLNDDQDAMEPDDMKVPKRDSSDLWEDGVTTIENNMEAIRNDLRDKGFTDIEEINRTVAQERLAAMEELRQDIEDD